MEMFSVYEDVSYGKNLLLTTPSLDEAFAYLYEINWYPYRGYYIHFGSLERENEFLTNKEQKS